MTVPPSLVPPARPPNPLTDKMGFASVSAGEPSHCDHEHVEGGDVELWLIRCPPGFDLSELHDRKVKADETTLLGSGSQSTGYCLRPLPPCEAAGIVGVFPSSRRKRWLLGKPVARQFAVSLAPAGQNPALRAEACDLPQVPQIKGLRMRHFSPGEAVPKPPAPREKRADEPQPSESKKVKKKGDIEGGAKKKAKKSA